MSLTPDPQSLRASINSALPKIAGTKRKRPLNICSIGAGYVGGPSAAIIADKAPDLKVTVVDIDEKRIQAWNSEQLPVYEPNLFNLIKTARDGDEQRAPNLFFSTQINNAIAEADLVFVGVNTPTKRTGLGAGRASDLGYLEAATRRIAKAAVKDMIVVEKSTVPVGTAESMREILTANANPGVRFDVLSNPEFLAEGTAIQNLLNPDRILIGCLETDEGYAAADALADIYARWTPREKIITMNLWSSELSKLAANALLAQRVSSINALSSICEATNAKIQDVAYACGLDNRLGPKMMHASVGFGGSCFRKDILNLVYISESLNLPEVAAYWQSVIEVNEYQKDRFTRRIVRTMHSTLFTKKLAILGFAYKKNTGDTRESPAISVVNNLLAENANVAIFDPKVRAEQIMQDLHLLPNELGDRVQICKDPYEACRDAHGVVIMTEWDMFSNKQQPSTKESAHSAARSTPIARVLLDDRMHASPLIVTPPDTLSEDGDSVSRSTGSDESTEASSPDLAPSTGAAQPTSTSTHERLDWSRIARLMQKPMYVFDGRNTVDGDVLEHLGFRVEAIGVTSRRQRIAMSRSQSYE